MSLTQDTYTNVTTSSNEIYNKGPAELEVNPENPFGQVDYGIIIKAFEMEATNIQQEDHIKASHYRDVYSTRHFSERVQEQMNYYPGIHQTTGGVPATDPFYTNAEAMANNRLGYWNNALNTPGSFLDGLRQNQADFDYADIFGSDVSAEKRAAEVGKMLAECVPCFGRLLDGAQLLPDGDLLEIHALNIKIRTDLLDKIRALFQDPGAFIDICDLLKLLSHMCPQDLLAILALLTQYLAKLNLDFRFNLDFIIQLVGPLLSPFLDALSAWLDKWIQLILAPIICVVDHINETILLAQNVQIPFSDVSANIGMDLGIAAPAHNNAAGTFGFAGDTGIGNVSGTNLDPHASAWTGWQWEEFNTPDAQKYNPTVPTPPSEETEMAREEIVEAWSPSFSEAEREERNARWEELKARQRAKVNYVPPPERYRASDGTRWSKDDIPYSEKFVTGGSWEGGYNPPENQTVTAGGTAYLDASPLVNSIVQMRNILQGGIQYIKDWFTYITQMIYDLLGTDFGWMTAKADNTILKSRIIQLIAMVKSIIQAIAKNGLECGTHTNFTPTQLKYILEDGLNKRTNTKFEVKPDGTIIVRPPGGTSPSVSSNNTELPEIPAEIPGPVPGVVIQEPTTDKQSYVESGIIIKDCFKSVSADELKQARAWIAEFEKGAV